MSDAMTLDLKALARECCEKVHEPYIHAGVGLEPIECSFCDLVESFLSRASSEAAAEAVTERDAARLEVVNMSARYLTTRERQEQLIRETTELRSQRDAAVSALIGILGKRDKEQRGFKGVSADAKVMIGPVTVATYRAGHAAIHAADARGEGEGK